MKNILLKSVIALGVAALFGTATASQPVAHGLDQAPASLKYNGITFNGRRFNGIIINGFRVNGFRMNGADPQGLAPLAGSATLVATQHNGDAGRHAIMLQGSKLIVAQD